ncbi:MAG: glycosyltransferase [Cyanobacteria bacterium P01_A01_bin.135]
MRKIALVHDYLTQRGGAERVFELFCQQFPDADIYTSVYDPNNTIDLQGRSVGTTKLQKIPGSSRYFRLLAPFYFNAFEELDLQEYDLILSSTTSFAKAVRKRPDARHICFCHNITRFLWSTETYLDQYKDFRPFYPVIEPIFKRMRKVDLRYAQNPDAYIANSTIVAERIRSTYGKPVLTVNYPIDETKFVFSPQKDDFYLVSSRCLGYKRIDIIVEAFNWLGLPLIIIGDGPERERLERRALGNIQFLGYVSDEQRTSLMSRAKAVIVAALEDYGLVPIEANASGTPVISYAAGGILDTQVPLLTGICFNRQSPDALYSAIQNFNKRTWDHYRIHQYVLDNFTHQVFFKKIESIIDNVCLQNRACA